MARKKQLELTIKGQIPSGKNQMLINPRTGRHYPNERFKLWRDEAMSQLMMQKRDNLRGTVEATFYYTPGDLRRRDVPGMEDALCHLLEKMRIVDDDSQIKHMNWTTNHMLRNDGAVIILLTEVSDMKVKE